MWYSLATPGVTPKVDDVGVMGGRVISRLVPASAAAGTGLANPATLWLRAMAAAGIDVAAALSANGPAPNCGP